jgi:hypothetical protein
MSLQRSTGVAGVTVKSNVHVSCHVHVHVHVSCHVHVVMCVGPCRPLEVPPPPGGVGRQAGEVSRPRVQANQEGRCMRHGWRGWKWGVDEEAKALAEATTEEGGNGEVEAETEGETGHEDIRVPSHLRSSIYSAR